MVLSLRSSKIVRSFSSSSAMVTSCLLTEIFLSAVYSTTIWLTSGVSWFAFFVSAGRLMSTPF